MGSERLGRAGLRDRPRVVSREADNFASTDPGGPRQRVARSSLALSRLSAVLPYSPSVLSLLSSEAANALPDDARCFRRSQTRSLRRRPLSPLEPRVHRVFISPAMYQTVLATAFLASTAAAHQLYSRQSAGTLVARSVAVFFLSPFALRLTDLRRVSRVPTGYPAPLTKGPQPST